MKKKIIENVKRIGYYLIPICLFIIYLQTAFNNCIWLDEAFSMSMIKQSFWEMICNTAIDVHPPLYYIILKMIISVFNLFIRKFYLVSKNCFYNSDNNINDCK